MLLFSWLFCCFCCFRPPHVVNFFLNLILILQNPAIASFLPQFLLPGAPLSVACVLYLPFSADVFLAPLFPGLDSVFLFSDRMFYVSCHYDGLKCLVLFSFALPVRLSRPFCLPSYPVSSVFYFSTARRFRPFTFDTNFLFLDTSRTFQCVPCAFVFPSFLFVICFKTFFSPPVKLSFDPWTKFSWRVYFSRL